MLRNTLNANNHCLLNPFDVKIWRLYVERVM